MKNIKGRTPERMKRETSERGKEIKINKIFETRAACIMKLGDQDSMNKKKETRRIEK